MTRQPTENEIQTVMTAFESILPHINEDSGTVKGSGWRTVYDVLEQLTDYELWLGLCNLEAAVFGSEQDLNVAHVTIFELFQLAYERRIESL